MVAPVVAHFGFSRTLRSFRTVRNRRMVERVHRQRIVRGPEASGQAVVLWREGRTQGVGCFAEQGAEVAHVVGYHRTATNTATVATAPTMNDCERVGHLIPNTMRHSPARLNASVARTCASSATSALVSAASRTRRSAA